MKQDKAMTKDRILQINKRSFLIVCAVLLAIMMASYVLTRFIPQGKYVDGNFEYINGTPLSFGGFLISPLETLWNSGTYLTVIVVSLFILILGGVFNLIDKTGGIRSLIAYLIVRNEKHKLRLMYSIILIFMLFGSLFGIFEESVTLLPMVVLLAVSLGWDTFTGLGMCLLAAGFGFSTAITNPFSIGLSISTVNKITGAELSVTDGILYRIAVFLLMYVILCTYMTLHVKRIEKHPEASPTYEQDKERRENYQIDKATPDMKAVRAYGIMFLAVVAVTVIVAAVPAISGYTIPAIALTFLFGGILCALLLGHRFGFIGKSFLSGVVGMLPAVLMILLASSVKLILDKGNIMDTIIYYMTSALSDVGAVPAILLIYVAILVIQFFIGSASAKVVVVVPIIAMIVSRLGLFSQNLALLAFIFGDGYTDLIYPTNPVLLIALGMVSFNYIKWIKKTALLQLIVLLLTAGLLLVGLAIGY